MWHYREGREKKSTQIFYFNNLGRESHSLQQDGRKFLVNLRQIIFKDIRWIPSLINNRQLTKKVYKTCLIIVETQNTSVQGQKEFYTDSKHMLDW